jgi:hypothetical protein
MFALHLLGNQDEITCPCNIRRADARKCLEFCLLIRRLLNLPESEFAKIHRDRNQVA